MFDLTGIITLFLVMDAFGNMPIVAGLLDRVAPQRRRAVIARESVVALLLLLVFLLVGPKLLGLLGIDPPALRVAGGVVLLLIALKMLFPQKGGVMGDSDPDGEPLIVPIATPLIAGPSAIATVMLLHGDSAQALGQGVVTVIIAWSATALVLLLSPTLMQWMGHRLALALERLMGMLLTVVAVQMLMTGIRTFITGIPG